MNFNTKYTKHPKIFRDRFSTQSLLYSTYRPSYPESLFRYLVGECRACKLAWDVGTGNGQAAHKLASHFETVYATDASKAQLSNAIRRNNITYAVAS